MAGKTKFSVTVSFDSKVPLSHVASGALQKEKGGQKTKKTLGVTKPHAEAAVPMLHWDEVTDPIAKTVTLAIKEVTTTVTFSVKIWVDKSIDKSSPCYAHVLDHEKRHAKIWAKGAKKCEKMIIRAVTDATSPTLDKPVQVKLSEAAKIRDEAFKRIAEALDQAVLKSGAAISKESKKIHTSSELKKTNSLCAAYLV